MTASSPHIGTLGERSLHAALKEWYAEQGDLLEREVDGYVIDIVRGDLLVEIQTQNFAAMKRKVADLTGEHPLRLVHPIAAEKFIVKYGPDGVTQVSRRVNDGEGSWRRGGWSIVDQRLIEVVDRVVLSSPVDFRALLPPDLPDPFTTRDMADALGERVNLMGKMAFCLRKMDAVEMVGRRGRAYLYSLPS
jgi:hypothetical protein